MAEARTGDTLPADFKTGSTDVSKIYAGSAVIWQRNSYHLLAHDNNTLTTHDNNQLSVEPVSVGSSNDPTSFNVTVPTSSATTMSIVERTDASACSVQLDINMPSYVTYPSATYSMECSGTGSHEDSPAVSYSATLNLTGNLADDGSNILGWDSEWSHDSPYRTRGTWGMYFNPQGTANSGFGTYNWTNEVVSNGMWSGGSLSVLVFGAGDLASNFSWTAPSSPSGTITGYQIQYKGLTPTIFDWMDFGVAAANVSGTSYTLANSASFFAHEGQYKFRIRALLSGSTSNWVEDATTYTMQLATHAGSKSSLSHAYCDD